MRSRAIRFCAAACLASAAILMPRALATLSVITGSVKDPSGGVMPGVTVEASSAVLDRWNPIDVRVAKGFQHRALRFQIQFDIFNLLNANNVLSVVETYGPSLDNPTSILQGRLFAIGAQMNF